MVQLIPGLIIVGTKKILLKEDPSVLKLFLLFFLNSLQIHCSRYALNRYIFQLELSCKSSKRWIKCWWKSWKEVRRFYEVAFIAGMAVLMILGAYTVLIFRVFNVLAPALTKIALLIPCILSYEWNVILHFMFSVWE